MSLIHNNICILQYFYTRHLVMYDNTTDNDNST